MVFFYVTPFYGLKTTNVSLVFVVTSFNWVKPNGSKFIFGTLNHVLNIYLKLQGSKFMFGTQNHVLNIYLKLPELKMTSATNLPEL